MYKYVYIHNIRAYIHTKKIRNAEICTMYVADRVCTRT